MFGDNCCGCGVCAGAAFGLPLISFASSTIGLAEDFKDFGFPNGLQPGDYVVVCCGGAWSWTANLDVSYPPPLSFDFGIVPSYWMCTEWGQTAQSWSDSVLANPLASAFVDPSAPLGFTPGGNTGASIEVLTNAGSFSFSELAPPGPNPGYNDAATAQVNSKGSSVVLQHGGGPIRVHFKGNKWFVYVPAVQEVPNFPSNIGGVPAPAPVGPPTFGLYGQSLTVAQAMQPGAVCINQNPDGTYIVRATVSNISGVNRSFTATLRGTGVTVHDVPSGQSTTLTPGQTVTFAWQSVSFTQTNIVLHMDLTVYGGLWGTLDFDTTPTIVLDQFAGIGIDHNCSPEQQRFDVRVHNTGFAVTNLQAQILLSASLLQVNDWGTCAPVTSLLSAGNSTCDPFSGAFSFNGIVVAGRPSSIQVQVAWIANGVTIQNSTYTVNLTWT